MKLGLKLVLALVLAPLSTLWARECRVDDSDSEAYYTTLKNAFDGSIGTQDSATITLIENITDASLATVEAGQTITFDLNGKTLKFTSEGIVNKGTLIIQDSVGGGKIIAGDSPLRNESGTMTVTGGAFEGLATSSIGLRVSGGEVIFQGDSIKGTEEAFYIEGGYVVLEGGQAEGGTGAWVKNNGKVTIKGGVLKGGDYGILVYDTASVTMSGGTLSAEKAIDVSGTATAEISGGSVSGSFYASSTGRLEVSGGTYTVDPRTGIRVTLKTGHLVRECATNPTTWVVAPETVTVGSLTLRNAIEGLDYTYADNQLTLLDGAKVSLSGETEATIAIAENAKVELTLNTVTVDIAAADWDTAIQINAGAALTLTLADDTTNTLKGGSDDSAIRVLTDATLTIQGGGTILGLGHGIDNNSGTLAIHSGTFDCDPSAYLAEKYQATAQGTDPETWTVDLKTCTVTVRNAQLGAASTTASTETGKYDDRITVTAPTPAEDEVFVGWLVNGELKTGAALAR